MFHKLRILFGTLMVVQVNGRFFFFFFLFFVSFHGKSNSFAHFPEFGLKLTFQCKTRNFFKALFKDTHMENAPLKELRNVLFPSGHYFVQNGFIKVCIF